MGLVSRWSAVLHSRLFPFAVVAILGVVLVIVELRLKLKVLWEKKTKDDLKIDFAHSLSKLSFDTKRHE